MAKLRKKTKELEFFQAALKLPLDKLERFSRKEFSEALLHFETALHTDRVFILRKYCADYASTTTVNLELQLEPCPTCEAGHVSLGELDSCSLTEVTAFLLQELLHHLEQRFQEHLPLVYPTFIEELRAIRARLEHLREGDGADSEDDEDNMENEV